jgi:ribosomal protein S18 acetylase RimI-like enzyme
MNREIPSACEFLSWDTDFFGHRIARVCGDTLNEEAVSRIDEWSVENRIEALYFLARADDPKTIQTAEGNGFGLTDIRMTYQLAAIPRQQLVPPNASSQASIRSAVPGDVAALRVIARTAHSDTRFFNDPHFDREKAGDLYETWIELECRGRADMVLVGASESGQAIGYLSCRLDRSSSTGSIGLLGVNKNFQGRGTGMGLVLAALEWFLAQGMQHVTVVTQANNLVGQRLYQRCGFLTRNVQLWYHKWYANEAQMGSSARNRAKKSG